MDSLVRRILESYDELGREALEFSTLAQRAAQTAGNLTPAERDSVGTGVAQLLEQGWLRRAGGEDLFARTEDGRLALAGPLDVTLYTRPGCHLCEEAKTQIAPLLREFGASLREINIEADPVLRERHTYDVPVIFLGSRKVAKHRIQVKQFRRLLEQAHR